MTLVIPDGYMEVAHEIGVPGSGGTQIWTMGLGIESGSAFEDAVAQWMTIVTGFHADQFASEYSLDLVHFAIGAATPPYLTFTVGGPGAGGKAITPAAPAQCVVVNKLTSTPGRQGRGRFFLSGVFDRDSVDEAGVVGSSEYASIQGALNDLVTAVDAADDIAGLRLLHDDQSPAAAPSPIVSLALRAKTTWLRSREY